MRSRDRAVRGAALAILGAPTAALAGSGEAAPGLAELAFRAGISLVGVLALIVGLAALLRRWRTAGGGGPARATLVPIDRLDLGGRREIRLVRVENRLLLVGVTAGSVTLLSELPADDGTDPSAVEKPRVLQRVASSS